MERGGRGRGGMVEGRSVTEVQLFREDVVQSVAQPAMVGVVSKVGGDSDSEESSDSEEEEEGEEGHHEDGGEQEDEAEEETVMEGSARVCWINSDETTEKLADIRVVDRAFLHGDIVARASDPLGQTGTVVDVEMRVDLELPNGEITKDVNSKRLRRVRAFALGDYVIHGLWLGRVDEVYDHVTVMFDDGAKCKVLRADPERLVPYNDSVMDDSGCPYFPGQKVRSTSASLFKSAKWLKGSWKVNRTEGVVIDVEAGSVVVYWIAAGNALSNVQSSAVPNEEQDAKRLLPMVYFSHTNWQLGDRSLPPARMRPKSVVPIEGSTTDGIPSDGDAESSLENNAARSPESVDAVCGSVDSCKDAWAVHRRKPKQRARAIKRDKKVQKKDKPIEYAVLVVNTRTVVDIVWQDGTLSKGLDACSLIPVDHLGDHDFWPEQYVMERGADGEGLDVEPRRVGIVKSVDAKQRTATVRWLKIVQRPEEPREFESKEVVSVYELVEHPDYSYCLGDVVIRLTPAPSPSDEIPSMDESEAAVSSGVDDTSEADVEDNEADLAREKSPKQSSKRMTRRAEPLSQDLSWVGVIIGLQDGDIEVAWADGMVSKVGPQAILVVNRDIEDSSSAHTSDLEDAEEDVDDAASWETYVSDDDLSRADQVESDQWAERRSWEQEPAEDNHDVQGQEGPGVESLSDTGANELGSGDNRIEENRPQKYGGPFKLPLVALGLVSRLATGLLGLRGSKKGADPAGGAKASSSQGSTYPKQGLEEILDEDKTPPYQEQVPHSPRGGVVERVAPCNRDALRMSNDAFSNTTDNEDSEQEVVSSSAATDIDNDERVSNMFRDSSTNSSEEPNQNSADVAEGAHSVHDGEELGDIQTELGIIKHFDSVKDPSDHHYVGETAQPTNNRKWVKKIQHEWSILQKNLPDTIYVRVYEDRMDLIRAVIVGAAGTPYHDGLFVFDLYLPPEYPSVPPVAHYHSGGLRLNPNLYENGKVCLSLLNTWTGKGSEIWHPSTSSILQLLVSIQGLVLNAKPYFNEAGYDRQVGTGEGEKNSLVYNENSFLLSCKSMLYLLRRPPRHFEEMIGEHFRHQGFRLLQACKAYLAGAEVGSLKESDLSDVTQREFEDQSSEGFKLMLKKLVPKLTAAFMEVGATVDASS